MKTWEMIKELTEHPEKKFRSFTDSSCQEDKLIYCIGANGYIGGIAKEYTTGFDANINEEWEEVKIPETFIEAYKKVEENHSLKFSQAKKVIQWKHNEMYLTEKETDDFEGYTGFSLSREWYPYE